MTEERKEFLASISKEEYFIREEIKGRKHLIRILKDCIGIASCESVANLHKRDISKYKTLIKSLKKQLPAPIKEGIFYNMKDFSCPTCGAMLDTCVENYCFNCGQKLR